MWYSTGVEVGLRWNEGAGASMKNSHSARPLNQDRSTWGLERGQRQGIDGLHGDQTDCQGMVLTGTIDLKVEMVVSPR